MILRQTNSRNVLPIWKHRSIYSVDQNNSRGSILAELPLWSKSTLSIPSVTFVCLIYYYFNVIYFGLIPNNFVASYYIWFSLNKYTPLCATINILQTIFITQKLTVIKLVIFFLLESYFLPQKCCILVILCLNDDVGLSHVIFW